MHLADNVVFWVTQNYLPHIGVDGQWSELIPNSVLFDSVNSCGRCYHQ